MSSAARQARCRSSRLASAEADPGLAGHHRVAAVRAHLLEMAGDHTAAREHYRRAARRTTSVPERRYLELKADDVEDGWRRAMVLMSSATPEELVDPDLLPHGLLYRLFHEEGVRVYDTHSLEARCRCSRERIAGILRAFPMDEIDEMKKEPVTTVTCEFCNTRYEFPAEDIARLARN